MNNIHMFIRSVFLLAGCIGLTHVYAAALPISECETSQTVTDARLGYEEIVPGKFYVIYSGISKPNQQNNLSVFETSNIYLIKGKVANPKTDRLPVWMFGAGYGNSGATSDVAFYRANLAADATRNADVDACYINAIIRDNFGWRNPARIDIRFITPHFHLDHVNQEIFSALWLKQYPVASAKLYVHAGDAGHIDLTCTTACCMTAQQISNGECRSSQPNWGQAYSDHWEANLLANKIVLGSTTDTECTTVSINPTETSQISSFTSAMGTWIINLGMRGRTEGPLSLALTNPTGVSYVLRGADLQAGQTDRCATTTANTIYLNIHGNIDLTPQ